MRKFAIILCTDIVNSTKQAAAAGEFWVSSTVRDMMLGGSTPFADPGQHALKGFNEHWRLYCMDRS